MKDLGNGNFEIRNKTTGQTKVVQSGDLPKYGLTAPNPSASDNPVVSGLHALGGGGITDVAGAAFEPGRMVRQATNSYGTGAPVEPNPFFTHDQKQGMKQDPTTEISKSMIKDLLGAFTIGGGVMAGGSTLPFLTKAGTAGLATKAAAKGTDIPWEKITQRATQGVSKLGNINQDKELRDTLTSLLERIKPNDILGQESMSSSQALDTRRQLLQRYGTTILDFLHGGPNLEQKVAGSLRTNLSQLLHESAPGTQLPDKLYSLYSKGGPLGGDIPSVALKYGLGLPLLKKLLGPLGGVISKSIQ